MKLHWSPFSPFVRKVMIVLHETGLTDRVDCVRSQVALHLPPNPQVLADNPLGKIPTLITEDGQTLFDSRVICEYLDLRAGTGLFPTQPDARFAHLRWQALADGVTDILLIWRTELSREAGPWEAVTNGWREKVRRAMATLDAEAAEISSAEFGIGQISVMCALGQFDFRWPDCDWPAQFPALAAFAAEMAARPSVAANPAPVDTNPDAAALTKGQLLFS
jgi:glutathione S-transferase